MIIECILRKRSISKGAVSNVLISLRNIVYDPLKMDMSVDFTELSNLNVIVSSWRMEAAGEFTVINTLKTSKIVFTPNKRYVIP